MKAKSFIYSVIIASSAFLAYNAFAADPVEISSNNVEIAQEKLKSSDIQPAVIEDLQPVMDDTKEQQELKEAQDKIKSELPALEDVKLPPANKIAAGNNAPVKVEVSSQRVPAGTVVPIKLETPINSVTSQVGDQFIATLTTDVIVGNHILLPAGSVVRGTIGNLKKANLCVKEAKIMLVFDHVVTPAGKQIPLYAYMTGAENINYDGYIVGGTSYAKAFKKDATKGKSIVVKSTAYGVDKGLAYLGGAPIILTAPVCALGGALGGGGYIIGKSVYNVFYKGGEVILENGTILKITLSRALDVPVN